MFQMFESGIRGGILGVSGDRYLDSNDENKIINVDQTNIYEWALQCLLYGEFKEDSNIKIEDILNTEDDNDIGYVLPVDLKYTNNIKERTKHFSLCPQKNNNTKISEMLTK